MFIRTIVSIVYISIVIIRCSSVAVGAGLVFLGLLSSPSSIIIILVPISIIVGIIVVVVVIESSTEIIEVMRTICVPGA